MQDQPQRDQIREKKRAQFADASQSKSKLTTILIVICAVLVTGGAYAILTSSGNNPPATTVTGSNPSTSGASNADIRIPISDLSSGKAKFFDYDAADNKAVRFFAVRSSDGVYRAAMDACDTCFHAKKGYRQEGDEMVCNNCGLKFPTNKINEIHGGCNPIGLPCKVEGDTLVISASELDSRNRYF